MLKVKDDVRPRNIVIAAAVANVSAEMETTLVVTAGIDGTHMEGSKHYSGEALDIRKFTLQSDQRKDFLVRIRKHLGPSYDVVEEPDHFHIEYDPK